MKKLVIISSLIVLFQFSVTAQKFSIEAGYTNPARTSLDSSTTYLNGNQLGITAEFKINNNISLLSGVLYSVAYGDKYQVKPVSSIHYYTFGMYADIPLRLAYSLPASKSLRFFGYGGPNLNIGLYQMQAINSTYSLTPTSFKNLYTESVLNRFNLQLGLGAGIQWNRLTLKTGYDYGLLQLNKTGTNKVYQNGWYATLAYDFGELKHSEKKAPKVKVEKKVIK